MTTPAWTTPRGHAPALDFERLAAMVENCAFHKWLGVKLKALDDTGVAIAMPWRAEFESDPVVGYAHGGILASLIDLAADYAVAARLGRGVPTVDMHVDYHRAAMPGPLSRAPRSSNSAARWEQRRRASTTSATISSPAAGRCS